MPRIVDARNGSNPQGQPALEDLRVFVTAARRSSFVAAAKELGVSASYVTKRIRVLEAALAASLFHRTTRRVVVSEDGERAFQWAMRILDDVDHLVEDVSARKASPRGLVRVCSSFGFGRNVVAPALSRLAVQHPDLDIRFEVFDRLVDVGAEGFDLDVRVGDEIAPQHIAKRIASNHRVLCASPAYVEKFGLPRSVADLANHDCLIIRERDHPFGVWRLNVNGREETVKVHGGLSTNHGEIATQWAVDGHGIVLRSVWDVMPFIHKGQLVDVLPGCRQEANVWAVYPARLRTSAKVRVCIEGLEALLPLVMPTSLVSKARKPSRRRAAATAALPKQET